MTELGDLCSIVPGVTFKKDEAKTAAEPEYLPVLRAGNIRTRLVTSEDLVWVPSERISPNQLLRTGDIVVCMSSGSPRVVGRC